MAEVAAHHHHPSTTRDTPSPRPHLHPLPQSQPQLQPQPQQQQQSAPHGKKRPGDNSLESEQRLSKRFDLLNLDKNGTRLYIPVPGSSDIAIGGAVNPLLQQQQTPTGTTTTSPIPLPASTRPLKKRVSLRKPHKPTPPSTLPQQQQTAANEEEFMQIDPTPHKIYIHDLSAELSSSSSEEDDEDGDAPPIFLSDIERHLSKIPRHVLLAGSQGANSGSSNRAPEARPDNQMVLYNVPSSLSVPQERDSVRKAIVEARARVRERQACGLVEPERVLLGSNGGGGGGDVGMGATASVTGVDAGGDVGMSTTPSATGVGAGGFGDIPLLRPEMADPDIDAMDID